MIAPQDLYDAHPVEPNGTAMLLLAGSSGRVESARADLLSQASGARVRAIRWFGGVGQRPAPQEVAVELFAEQIDLLRREADRVVLFGTSFGAEASLVTASLYDVDAVIAVAPSSVVWAGAHQGEWSSHWTHKDEPLPFVPFAADWMPDADPPAFVSLYEKSADLDPAVTEAARISVERIAGEVLLVVGGDDQVWPSARFADAIVATRASQGLATTVLSEPAAGHRLLLPGETPATGGVSMQRGGTPEADAALGLRAWPEIVRVLGGQSD